MQTWSDRPTLDVCDSCFFLPFFSQDISTGFSESGCKTLSLLSSPFAQFHFKAITRNNHGFIPCKTSSRPKTSCSFSIKSGSQQTKNQKKDNLGFVSASGVRREENPQYGGVVIWHTLLSDTLYFLYLRRQSGTFVIVLSWEVSFSSSAFKMAWDDPQTKTYKREQEQGEKNFLCLCHVCGWFRRQTGCWVLQKECPRAIQSYCLTINGHHPYKLQNVQTKKRWICACLQNPIRAASEGNLKNDFRENEN